jgi:hypothetical protein
MADGDTPNIDVNVSDNQAVSDLALKVGALQEGMATKADIEAMRRELAGIAASTSQTITRADYDKLSKQVTDMQTKIELANRAPAEIKPPAPPPPTPEEIAASQQAAESNGSTGPPRFHVGIFR